LWRRSGVGQSLPVKSAPCQTRNKQRRAAAYSIHLYLVHFEATQPDQRIIVTNCKHFTILEHKQHYVNPIPTSFHRHASPDQVWTYMHLASKRCRFAPRTPHQSQMLHPNQ
jgi:hypothetical protein